jgi:hypothetical protein
MKDLIRNILREEVGKSTNIEKYLNPVVKYFMKRTLPSFICFTTVMISEYNIIVLFQYNQLVSQNIEQKIQKEINNVFKINDIWVTGFFGDEHNCEKRLEKLKYKEDYNKTFFIIPNKNYNP